MEEIEKLRLRVEKDPNSRLFLPLAEEYRKSGMVDEAISVILKGLEHQPGYTSARVALGRLYVEKNLIEDAKNEFEKVVVAIPDNLFAHKKLAEIYKLMGDTQKATAQYHRVLELNPLDDDARMALAETDVVAETLADSVSLLAEETEKDMHAEVSEVLQGNEHVHEEKPGAESPEPADTGFEEFKASFSKEQAEEAVGIEEFFGIPEDQVFDLEAEPALEGGVGEELELPQEGPDLAAPTVSPAEVKPSEGGNDIASADAFVTSGRYSDAVQIYREILAKEPGNKAVLQRLAELKAFLKLIGKGDDVLIARLEAFLQAIKSEASKHRETGGSW